MAYENKTILKAPSLSDTQARDHLIAVALRVILENHLVNKKWNPDEAATWAVRYANSTMVARANTEPLKVVVSKGTVNQAEPPQPPKSTDEKPPSIAEIIGDKAEELEEVK